ncbi:MAG: SDR family oxidoreductase [Actinomycetota bacterium]
MRARPSLDGATVLVTGAGNGLGRRLVLQAARRGAAALVWDLDGAAAEATAETVRAEGGRAEARTVDVADRGQVEAAAEATLAGSGPVDVVVHNAGVVAGAPLLEAPAEAIERTFAVNVLPLYWVTQAFLPTMLARQRGSVVTIASAAGLIGVARQTDYAASKHAAVGFTESLRAELRTAGARVHTLLVCPFYLDTGMFDGVRTRWPRLLPILDADDVATRVLDSLERGRAELVLPPLARLTRPLRALPVGLYDRLADALGVNDTMTTFTGHGR